MARTNDVWETAGPNGTYIQTIDVVGFDVLINGTNKYLNFNTAVGTDGYGFRDNNGTIQWKNSGGSWADIGAGGGGAVDSVNSQTGVVVLDTGDIADSLNARYVTDAQLTVISNTSGTNTGDNAVNSLYSGLASSKQDALSGTGFVKISGTTISYDNSTYLTGNQTITLSGDITGSGATSITTTISAGAVDIAMLSATGTPSSSTYLRGDNTWATISSGGLSWGDSVSGTTADGVTLTLSNSTNDAASALKLIAGNTQANQSALANLQLGTSGNVQGLLIQGTSSNTVGAVGTGKAHLTIWGDTASNKNTAISVGNEVAYTETFRVLANGGMYSNWTTLPANPAFGYGWDIEIGNVGDTNREGIRMTFGDTQGSTGMRGSSIYTGTSGKPTAYYTRGTFGNLNDVPANSGSGVYIHGNTANQNTQAFGIANGTGAGTIRYYISTAGQTVQNLAIATVSASSVTLPASVTSAKAGYEVTLDNTQANSPYGFLANVGTSAKVTGAMVKGTFGTATTGLTSAFTAWGNTAAQATRAFTTGNGTSYTETAFINTDGKATVVDLTTTGNIELGHASDTTLSRVSAGIVAIEGNEIVTKNTGVYRISRTLTATEIINGQTTPIELIPAPGANKIITIVNTAYFFSYSAAFTGSGNLYFYYGTDTTASIDFTGADSSTLSSFTESLSYYGYNLSIGNFALTSLTNTQTVNKAVNFRRSGVDTLAGGSGSTLTVTITYYIQDVS